MGAAPVVINARHEQTRKRGVAASLFVSRRRRFFVCDEGRLSCRGASVADRRLKWRVADGRRSQQAIERLLIKGMCDEECDLQATAVTRRFMRRDSPSPKASGCLSAKREPRRGRKGPSRATDAPRFRGRALAQSLVPQATPGFSLLSIEARRANMVQYTM